MRVGRSEKVKNTTLGGLQKGEGIKVGDTADNEKAIKKCRQQ